MIDDHFAIENHPDVIEPQGLWQLWHHNYWTGQTADKNLYRPITVLSFHLGARSTGPQPAAFRAVNVLLLAALATLAALWMQRYVHPAAAWLAAFLFAAHPAHTEAINHIVGRADLQALLGIVAFAVVQQSAMARGRWSRLQVLAALAAAAVAMGSKETGLVLIAVASAQAWIAVPVPPGGRGDGPNTAARTSTGFTTSLLVLGPATLYLLARAAVVGWRVDYQPGSDDLTLNPLRALGDAERLPAALSIAWHYCRQVLWPSTAYNQIPARLSGWSSPTTILGIAVLASVAVALAAALRRRHWLGPAATLVLAHFLIVGNLLLPIGTFAANRLMLPFTLAAAMVAAAVIDRLTRRGQLPWALAGTACGLLVIVMAQAVQRSSNQWSGTLRLMQAGVRAWPDNPVAAFHLGTAYARSAQSNASPFKARDQLAQARRWLQRAVDLRPGSVQARRNLARTAQRSGDLALARAQYEWILRLDPESLEALTNLAGIALIQNKPPVADQYLRQAAKIDATHPDVMHNRAVLAYDQGDLDEAVRCFEALLRRFPNHNPGRQQLEQIQAQLQADEAN